MVHIVANGTSGVGSAMARADSLQTALGHHGLDATITATGSAEDATRLVRSLPENVTVVSVGGDGTHRAVAAGCIGQHRKMSLLPAGTGNDYAAGLGVATTNVNDLARAIATQTTRWVDVGLAWLDEDTKPHVFLNAFGMGFDADVAAHLKRLPRLPALASYAWATFRRLPHLRASEVNVTSDGGLIHAGPAILTTALIGRQTGGGFAFAPHANFDQGALHTVIGGNLSLMKVSRAALQLVQGEPLHVAGVTTGEALEIELSWASPTYTHLDGDSVGSVKYAKVAVRPAGLTLVVPRR